MKRRDEVLVGVFITAALLVGIAGSLWLARRGFGSGYTMYSQFPWGAGLKTGQQVLLAGVSVGYVDQVELKPNGYLDVTLEIERAYSIPEGTTATVVAVGFFGDQAIALTPDSALLRGLPDGVTIPAMAPGDTIPRGRPAPTIAELLLRVDTITADVSDLTSSLNRQFVTRGGFQDVHQTVESTQRLVDRLAEVAAEQSRNVTATLAMIRRSAAAIDSVTVDSLVRNVNQTTANLAILTTQLNQTTTQLNGVLAKLENGEGTAGKLLSDTTLYSNVRNLVARVDSLTADFKKNPRKYINLEIF
jgi:phospholipid/cholesterol/gamma-HCH transport system substrate-binding protein